MHLDAEKLALSSRKWMAAAFAAFTDEPSSEGMAVHHAGVATEHLLKALLASIHPSLIVDGKDFNSLLYAAGQGGLAQVRGSRVKTIQLAEAYDRVTKVLPGKLPPRPQGREPWPLADARNGVAHAGYYDRSDVIEVLTSCIGIIDPLLVELGIGSEYWGDHTSLHDELLTEGVEAARLQVEQKLARARRVFTERFGHIDEGSRQLAISAMGFLFAERYVGDHSAPVNCPACPAQGMLLGFSYVDEEREVVVLTPVAFECPGCALRLQIEEFGHLASPFEQEVTLDVSPDDFYSEMEPDEDYELPPDESDDEETDVETDYSTKLLRYRKRI
ncbi:hypothetical protein [Streptomyces microflavus]|uniref:hypothetical protein n=1 Tax=Streptomyces microflavus TaxID=1919 RepID=UPI003826AAA7